jgi:AraC-like DNA-binding protein
VEEIGTNAESDFTLNHDGPLAQQQLIEREPRRFRERLGAFVDPHWPAAVRLVVWHFHAHLFDPDLTVEGACRTCSITSGRFAGAFKRACGTTMHGYVEDRRMMAALRLMTFEALELRPIAHGIGYASYRTFGRAFKRHFGQTPTQLRKRVQAPGYAPAAVEPRTFRRLVRAGEAG